MKKTTLVMASLIILLLFIKCNSDLNAPISKSSTTELSDDLSKIKALGFNPEEVEDLGDSYLVEGDINIYKKNLDTQHNLFKLQQNRTDFLVLPAIVGNISVFIDPSMASWTSIIQGAVDDWNDVHAKLKFNIVQSPGAYITIVDKDLGDVLGRGDWIVSDGLPGDTVRINITRSDEYNSIRKKYLVMHELAHNIGMHHTSRNSSELYGTHIEGTPVEDESSIMNPVGMPDEAPNNHDKYSVQYLYPPVEPTGSSRKVDMIYWRTNAANGQLSVFNNTNGHYFTSAILNAGSTSSDTKFYFADVNGDGMDDRIYWNYNASSGQLQIQLATGGGQFSTSTISQTGSTYSYTNFYFADVNGDGMADKIYWRSNAAGGKLQIQLATGNGQFSTSTISQSGSTYSNTKFYFTDVNGDGKDDRIYWNYTASNGQLQIQLATGGGQFSTNTIYQSGSTSSDTKFYFADINGDGMNDKIYWNYNAASGQLLIQLATGGGQFSSSTIYQTGSAYSYTNFYFADVNGDGKADKIYRRYDAAFGNILINYGKGNGEFEDWILYARGSEYSNTNFYFADVDGN